MPHYYEEIGKKPIEEQLAYYTGLRDFWKAAAEKYPSVFNRQQHARYERYLKETEVLAS